MRREEAEYAVIVGETEDPQFANGLDRFVAEVEAALNDGWKLSGGVAIDPSGRYYRALYRTALYVDEYG